MSPPLLITIGRNLAPELVAFARELQRGGIVYAFESATELIASWQLAQQSEATDVMSPAAVVWLQSRSGEFSQREVDVLQTIDPLARHFVVAGCWSEGEPRSGKPLAGATRVYWHQGPAAIVSLLSSPDEPQAASESAWIAIHTAQHLDYVGLAGMCQSLGHRTLWQSDRGPAISSEPAVRIFAGWPAWEAWQEQKVAPEANEAEKILLLGFPRPFDQQRALDLGLTHVVAQPSAASELPRAIASALKRRGGPTLSLRTEVPPLRLAPVARRRSA